ncbi:hypothetical protein Hanom_Chr04g00303441 [Helianthus anomalus]
MKEFNDAEADKMPIEPETENAKNIEEIVFEGESSKSTYVRADGMEFDPFDEEWMKANQEDLDEPLKNQNLSYQRLKGLRLSKHRLIFYSSRMTSHRGKF